MAKLSEMKNTDLIRVFVYGEAGTGKTVGAASFPGPIKFYDFDGKISSAYSYLSKHDKKKLEEIDYEDCSPKDSKGSGFKVMSQSLGEIEKEFKKTGVLPYKTLVIDSSTIMATEMLAWLINFETGIKRNKDIKSRIIPAMQDYQVFGPTFADFIFSIFALPWNIVMTGHIKIQQDELTGSIERTPMIPGQMAKQVPIFFPEVYVSTVKQDKYMVQTKADFKFPCRSQIQGLPKEIEFTYKNLTKQY